MPLVGLDEAHLAKNDGVGLGQLEVGAIPMQGVDVVIGDNDLALNRDQFVFFARLPDHLPGRDHVVFVAGAAGDLAVGDLDRPGDIFDAQFVVSQKVDRQRHELVLFLLASNLGLVAFNDGVDFEERRYRADFAADLELQGERRCFDSLDFAGPFADDERVEGLEGAVAERLILILGRVELDRVIVHRVVGRPQPRDRERRQDPELYDFLRHYRAASLAPAPSR